MTFNKKNTHSKLRDKIPARPCGATDSMYLTNTGVNLLEKLFCLNPDQRISATEALQHPWFAETPARAEEMPNFPEMNKVSRDQLKRNRRNSLDERQLQQRDEMIDND